jgi:hypothetical protein
MQGSTAAPPRGPQPVASREGRVPDSLELCRGCAAEGPRVHGETSEWAKIKASAEMRHRPCGRALPAKRVSERFATNVARSNLVAPCAARVGSPFHRAERAGGRAGLDLVPRAA